MALVFYHGHGSPYSWRVWLALEHKRVAYELKVLSFADGDTKKPEFVAINPRHHVPTIVDDGFALWESTVILEYLDERFAPADAAQALYPGRREGTRARPPPGKGIEEYLDNEGHQSRDRGVLLQGRRRPRRGEGGEGAREACARRSSISRANCAQASSRESTPTAADYVLYPYYAYVARLTLRKPEVRLTELVPAPIAQWGKRIEALPFFDKTYPPHWR